MSTYGDPPGDDSYNPHHFFQPLTSPTKATPRRSLTHSTPTRRSSTSAVSHTRSKNTQPDNNHQSDQTHQVPSDHPPTLPSNQPNHTHTNNTGQIPSTGSDTKVLSPDQHFIKAINVKQLTVKTNRSSISPEIEQNGYKGGSMIDRGSPTRVEQVIGGDGVNLSSSSSDDELFDSGDLDLSRSKAIRKSIEERRSIEGSGEFYEKDQNFNHNFDITKSTLLVSSDDESDLLPAFELDSVYSKRSHRKSFNNEPMSHFHREENNNNNNFSNFDALNKTTTHISIPSSSNSNMPFLTPTKPSLGRSTTGRFSGGMNQHFDDNFQNLPKNNPNNDPVLTTVLNFQDTTTHLPTYIDLSERHGVGYLDHDVMTQNTSNELNQKNRKNELKTHSDREDFALTTITVDTAVQQGSIPQYLLNQDYPYIPGLPVVLKTVQKDDHVYSHPLHPHNLNNSQYIPHFDTNYDDNDEIFSQTCSHYDQHSKRSYQNPTHQQYPPNHPQPSPNHPSLDLQQLSESLLSPQLPETSTLLQTLSNSLDFPKSTSNQPPSRLHGSQNISTPSGPSRLGSIPQPTTPSRTSRAMRPPSPTPSLRSSSFIHSKTRNTSSNAPMSPTRQTPSVSTPHRALISPTRSGTTASASIHGGAAPISGLNRPPMTPLKADTSRRASILSASSHNPPPTPIVRKPSQNPPEGSVRGQVGSPTRTSVRDQMNSRDLSSPTRPSRGLGSSIGRDDRSVDTPRRGIASVSAIGTLRTPSGGRNSTLPTPSKPSGRNVPDTSLRSPSLGRKEIRKSPEKLPSTRSKSPSVPKTPSTSRNGLPDLSSQRPIGSRGSVIDGSRTDISNIVQSGSHNANPVSNRLASPTRPLGQAGGLKQGPLESSVGVSDSIRSSLRTSSPTRDRHNQLLKKDHIGYTGTGSVRSLQTGSNLALPRPTSPIRSSGIGSPTARPIQKSTVTATTPMSPLRQMSPTHSTDPASKTARNILPSPTKYSSAESTRSFPRNQQITQQSPTKPATMYHFDKNTPSKQRPLSPTPSLSRKDPVSSSRKDLLPIPSSPRLSSPTRSLQSAHPIPLSTPRPLPNNIQSSNPRTQLPSPTRPQPKGQTGSLSIRSDDIQITRLDNSLTKPTPRRQLPSPTRTNHELLTRGMNAGGNVVLDQNERGQYQQPPQEQLPRSRRSSAALSAHSTAYTQQKGSQPHMQSPTLEQHNVLMTPMKQKPQNVPPRTPSSPPAYNTNLNASRGPHQQGNPPQQCVENGQAANLTKYPVPPRSPSFSRKLPPSAPISPSVSARNNNSNNISNNNNNTRRSREFSPAASTRQSYQPPMNTPSGGNNGGVTTSIDANADKGKNITFAQFLQGNKQVIYIPPTPQAQPVNQSELRYNEGDSNGPMGTSSGNKGNNAIFETAENNNNLSNSNPPPPQTGFTNVPRSVVIRGRSRSKQPPLVDVNNSNAIGGDIEISNNNNNNNNSPQNEQTSVPEHLGNFF
jgi:hypothetical protein